MFKRIKNAVISYWFSLYVGGLLLTLFGFWYLGSVPRTNVRETMQEALLERIRENKSILEVAVKQHRTLSKEEFVKRYQNSSESSILHIYSGDSLVYWNTNKFPISNYADVRFPINGIIRLQNGWYYSNSYKKGDLTFVASFGIKRAFPLKNSQLNDYFFPPFPDVDATIELSDVGKNTLVDDQGNPLFQLKFKDTKEVERTSRNWSFALILLLVVSVLVRLLTRIHAFWTLISLALGLLLLRWLLFRLDVFDYMSVSELFNPENLALNVLMPNAGELVLWLIAVLFSCLFIGKALRRLPKNYISWLLFFITPCLALAFPATVKWVITNSTIPLDLHDLLYLNWFSIGFLFVLAVLAFLLVKMYYFTLTLLESQRFIGMHALYFFLFLVVVNEFTFRLHGFWIIWIFALYLATWYLVWKKSVAQFSSQLLILFIISWGITFNCITEGIKKEHEDRIIFANQLADDRDLNAEVDFTLAHEKLSKEPFLKRLFSAQNKPSFSELKEAMEFRVFNGYWDRYDVDFYYYNPDTINVNMNGVSRSLLDELIENHGKASELDSTFYYIQDYTTQFNYIFKMALEKEGKKRLLYGTLKSKRIPEKIGFPRILISQQTSVFESLEKYSIAKYFNKQLVSNYGSFEYPLVLERILNIKETKNNTFIQDGLNEHLVLIKSKSDAIVLTKSLPSWLDYLTSTSIVLVSLGCIYFLGLLFYRLNSGNWHLLINMEAKVQLTLIGLIVLSLIGFSLGSSQILYKQYGAYAYDQIRGKMRALENEVQLRQSNLASGYLWDRRDNFDFQIRRWSKVFQSDINVFDQFGRLKASSRSKIYTIGLLGERMNSDALISMRIARNSEFVHEENIGNLKYLAGYTPIFGHDHSIIGYLNLLHFDQRNAFDNQLKQFFVAILNVFMLLLVFSVLVAIFVSSWITKPLQLLRQSFSKVELGKSNQRIDYKSEDEIGYLVAEYNHKLTELAEAAAKLAQSERESAWREMAKQVAHEIKNPLTPMKLNIQQMQRVLDPNDPQIVDKIKKLSNSLMEQIDALTSIANAFASFAKLPQPSMQSLEVNHLVQTVVDFFHADTKVEVIAELLAKEVTILGDKEMLLRVLNNLITNGIQAVSSEVVPHIVVRVLQKDKQVTILVIDNGRGISEDQRERIFEPYFTTKSTGTGLGLAMVKQIVEQHNGTIHVLQSNALGTTIQIDLPIGG